MNINVKKIKRDALMCEDRLVAKCERIIKPTALFFLTIWRASGLSIFIKYSFGTFTNDSLVQFFFLVFISTAIIYVVLVKTGLRFLFFTVFNFNEDDLTDSERERYNIRVQSGISKAVTAIEADIHKLQDVVGPYKNDLKA